MGVVFVLLVMKPFLHFRKEFLKVLLPKLLIGFPCFWCSRQIMLSFVVWAAFSA